MVERLLSAPALQFKGSGWYVTDYGRNGSNRDKTKTEPADNKKNGTPKAESSKSADTATSGSTTTKSDK
jgi:predicted nucleic acid-binding Zn ribbon protein